MDARYIALAVPVFFLLIGGELLLSRRQTGGDTRYRLHDTISNLSNGVGQQVLGVLVAWIGIVAYGWVHDHLRVATIPTSSVVGWVAVLFGVDLCYYWYHRASHRVNFFWATHVVHHQSEEYNLSAALRQSWFTQLTSWIFYLPLAVLGFPPLMFLLMHTFNTLYQFWIHTRTVRRMGLAETVMNTPSHHRVHHGVNPRYIDANYAGIFIIWDRMFGTFRPEADEPVYGTVKPLASWNPLWANVADFVRLGQMTRATRRLRDKLFLWLAPPEWRPADLGGRVTIPEVSREAQRKYDVACGPAIDRYVGVHFALATVGAGFWLWFEAGMSRPDVIATAVVFLVGLIAWAGLVEGRRWAVPLELVRLVLVVAAAAWLWRGGAAFLPAIAGASAYGVGSAVWALRLRRAATVSESVRAAA
jgi:alkylglycerol monooxygenase